MIFTSWYRNVASPNDTLFAANNRKQGQKLSQRSAIQLTSADVGMDNSHIRQIHKEEQWVD